MPDDLDADTFELINTELAERLKRQIDSGKSIDTKAGIVAGFASVAAQFLAARDAQPVLAGVAFGAYAFAFLFGVWSFAVIAYQDVPVPRWLFQRYGRRSKRDTLVYLAAARVAEFEANERKHKRKATRWWISVGFLALGLVFSVLAIVQDDQHDKRQGQHQPAGRRGPSVTASL